MIAGSNSIRRENALRRGLTLSRYIIDEVIGRGGFGMVYRARHTDLDNTVAIKEYLPDRLAIRDGNRIVTKSVRDREVFEDGLHRFREEARRLVEFQNHPSIVTCHDFFRRNGTAYLVMEYVDGTPLSGLLARREEARRPFDEADLLDRIVPLLEGLAQLHDAGVVHRDVKPSNILVRKDGRPVLIDFGAAKQDFAKHTKSAAPFTDGYAALEQVGQGRIGPWTDIYATGAVMWRMVAGGNPPWSPPNPLKVETRAHAKIRSQKDPLPTAHELGSGRFRPGILRCIDECLRIEETKRPKTCREVKRMLGLSREVVTSKDTGSRKKNTSLPPTPSPRVQRGANKQRKKKRRKNERLSAADRWKTIQGTTDPVVLRDFAKTFRADPSARYYLRLAQSRLLGLENPTKIAPGLKGLGMLRPPKGAKRKAAVGPRPRKPVARKAAVRPRSPKGAERKAAVGPRPRKGVARKAVVRSPRRAIPQFTNDLGMDFVWIPAGSFLMGSTSDEAYSNEKPRTKVKISRGFYMSKYQVTQEQWQALMGSNPSHFKSCGPKCPVESVSWNEVLRFLRRLNAKDKGKGYRLPTEAQWEYSARGTTTGDRYDRDLGAIAWYNENSGLCTHPVGQMMPNKFGLLDMLGNVSEWVYDWYGDYPGCDVVDPVGPRRGSNRVVRGGGWTNAARICRSSRRSHASPRFRGHNLGFRIVRTK